MRTNRFPVFVVCLLLLALTARTGAEMVLGVMGDSLSDEYAEETYGAYATNWVQQLVLHRGADCGLTALAAGRPGGTWGEPRRTGYEQNWARSGDTAGDLLAHGQHTGLAGQIASGTVTHAVLAVGANDFHPAESAFFNIYYGLWSTTQTSNYCAGVLTNIETALATVATSGVRMVVMTLLDFGSTPAVYNFYYPNDSRRDRVTAAIATVNTGLVRLAQKYQVPVADAFRFQKTLFGPNTNLRATAAIGGVTIQLQEGDTDPLNNPNRTAAFVEDEAHPHTTIQGAFANVVIQAFRQGYGETMPLFSEAEILAHAGLTYGGTDTLAAYIGAYGDYVILPVKPRIASATLTGSGFELRFSTVSNQTYRVEAAGNLSPASWAPLTNNVPGTGSIVTIIDGASTVLPQRFYRVRQLP